MAINFEDAVDEILTGKKKSHTEASLASRIKSRMTEEINVKEILSEKEVEEPTEKKAEKKADDTSIKKRISDKEEENEIEDDSEKNDQDKSDQDKKSNAEMKKKMKKEYLENLKRDDVLQNEFEDCIYKTTKDPEGPEVFRIYMRINSENVNIKRFGRSEILQYGDLNSILSKYGSSKETLIDIQSEAGVMDAIDAASTPTGDANAAETKDKKSVDSFKFVLKRISEASSSFEIICASKKNDSANTASAVVSSLGMITNFDTRQQALDYVDLQYSTLILKDIGASEGV